MLSLRKKKNPIKNARNKNKQSGKLNITYAHDIIGEIIIFFLINNLTHVSTRQR